MNMSGHYSGQYYQLFGPPNQSFGQPNQRYRQPNYPPSYPRDEPPNYPGQPQYFAEYSLWGNAYDSPIQSSFLFPTRPPTSEEPPQPCVRPQVSPKLPDDIHSGHELHTLEFGGTKETISSGLEKETVKIITKEELFKPPNGSDYSDFIDPNPDSTELSGSSNSSSSGSGDWTSSNFQRAGSAYPWASRSARVINNRGKKANAIHRRLGRALSQPVKMEKGASIMERMGWMGGGLGRDESGMVDPIEPNAVYASSTVGFGQEEIPQTMRSKRIRFSEKQRIGPKMKENFKTNVLMNLLDFVKNDLCLELYFDTQLKNSERKRIHVLVAGLGGRDSSIQLDSIAQQELVNEIHRRNRYTLDTQSEGDNPNRQICVFKSAPDDMFLVTPNDCRPCTTDIKEVEEEPNPFLKSITKHIRHDEGTILEPKPMNLFDKLVAFFIDFCDDEVFKEFRFLGPFTDKEINVINNFLNLIEDLSEKRKPNYKIPIELLDVFATEYRFYLVQDPNDFCSIKKVHFDLKEEYEKLKQEERERRTKTISRQEQETGPL